jgi:thiamine pyrophosphate-dependent acetolactate synthase large subunit-like protein
MPKNFASLLKIRDTGCMNNSGIMLFPGHALNVGMLGMRNYSTNLKTNECDLLIGVGMVR